MASQEKAKQQQQQKKASLIEETDIGLHWCVILILHVQGETQWGEAGVFLHNYSSLGPVSLSTGFTSGVSCG